MKLKKNIQVGKISYLIILFYFVFVNLTSSINALETKENPEGKFIELKILDKVSSKNNLLKITIGKEEKFKNLLIKGLKCKNSEFDDNPEITAYIQVKDLTNKDKNDVFVFNGWMFSSSPSIAPFDHPVYDIWIVSCY